MKDDELKRLFAENREEMLRYFDERFGQVDSRLDRMDARFDGIDARLDGMDRRFDEVDRRFDKIDERFDKIDERFEQVDARFGQVDARFTEVDRRFTTVDEHFAELHNALGAMAEEFSDQLKLIAEGVGTVDERAERRTKALEERMEQGFAETYHLIKFTYDDSERRRPPAAKRSP